ncbi:unnamed protein product [Caenorhabditis angaria]|uniref:Uncharacterized protein n=1 Tax=Caenorhabditis angaria TaxID=860376 RepID=A0A9P1MS12_9PELO|nr:unnamed protein product [Caenorhabditis angaria]
MEDWLVEELVICPRRIELLRKAKKFKNFRISPTILKKLDNMEIDDILPNPKVLSTVVPTSSNFVEPPKRTQRKRQVDDSKKEQICTKCRGKLFRVVDNERPDKRLILECMRRDCLATFNFTDLPVGTIVGEDVYTADSFRRDPLRFYYPTKEDIAFYKKEFEKEPTTSKNVIENDRGALLISVPGQIRKVRLM